MYCHNCGKEINDDVKFCPYCGVQVKGEQVYSQQGQSHQKDEKSLGFGALSFFIPIVGLVFYVLWKDELPLRAKSCLKGLIAGVVLYVVLVCCVFSSFFALVSNDSGFDEPVYYDGEFYGDFPFN